MNPQFSYRQNFVFLSIIVQAVNTKQERKMDRPSNGLSIVGCLRPAFIDEESYLRRLFHRDDDDGSMSDWRGISCPGIR